MNQRVELNLRENCALTDAISESTEGSVLARVMDAARRRTCRFKFLESLVDASLEFCPFRELVLGTGSHELCFG